MGGSTATTMLLTLLLAASLFLPADSTCSNRKPRVRWREDGRCGPKFPLGGDLIRGTPSQCDPRGDRPCCSDYGYCGNTHSHCNCANCIDYRKVPPEPVCFFSLNGDTGLLESPGFPEPYTVSRDCCYDIRRPDETVCGISLTVENLDLGTPSPGGGCDSDYLSLPSCAPESGTRICGNLTGQIYEYLYQPSAQSIRFVFHTGDTRGGHRGFRIRYEQLRSCPGPYQTQEPPITAIPGTGGAPCYTNIDDLKGSINTPYYPRAYPNSLDCVYEFQRTSEAFCGIRMRSITFSMAPSINTIFGGACTDFLHLPSCGFLCGSLDFSWKVEFQPGAKSLRFHFHSDENSKYEGFRIAFEQITEC